MNFVITLSKSPWIHEAPGEWIRRLFWQCYDEIHCQWQDRRITNWHQFVFNDNKLNCLIARSRSLTRSMNFKFMCLSPYWPSKLANERAWISAVIVKNTIHCHVYHRSRLWVISCEATTDCDYGTSHARKSRPNSKVLFSSTKILKYLTASSNFENVIGISQGGLSQDQSWIQALSFNRAKSRMLASPAFQRPCMYFAFA